MPWIRTTGRPAAGDAVDRAMTVQVDLVGLEAASPRPRGDLSAVRGPPS